MTASQPIYFDDAGQRVPVCEMDFAAMDERMTGKQGDDGERIRLAQQEAAIRVLQVVCGDDARPEEAGRRAILLLQTLRPVKSQREVAQKLNMTPGRVSQLLNALSHQISNVFKVID